MAAEESYISTLSVVVSMPRDTIDSPPPDGGAAAVVDRMRQTVASSMHPARLAPATPNGDWRYACDTHSPHGIAGSQKSRARRQTPRLTTAQRAVCECGTTAGRQQVVRLREACLWTFSARAVFSNRFVFPSTRPFPPAVFVILSSCCPPSASAVVPGRSILGSLRCDCGNE
jgi:hypothetical protein